MKTKEELENIKERLEKLNAELHELTDEELEQVTGGVIENKLENELIDETKDKFGVGVELEGGLGGGLGGKLKINLIDDTKPEFENEAFLVIGVR